MSLLKLLGYAVLMAYFWLCGLYLGVTAGTMLMPLSSINRLFDPLIEVTQNFYSSDIMVSAGRVFALIDVTNYEQVQENKPSKFEGNIHFIYVSFSYDRGAPNSK